MATLLEKAIRYEYPETIPVSVSILPAAWLKHGEDLQKIVDKYPQFFSGYQYNPNNFEYSPSYHKGLHTDEWGCVWENVYDGMDAIVTGHPVKSEEDVFALQIPERNDGHFPHGFMYLRLLDLCGFELGMMMFAEEDEAIDTLISKVLKYNEIQMKALIPRLGSMAIFGDDLGMQHGLAIGAERWRKYMKPCFKKLYGMIKEAKPDIILVALGIPAQEKLIYKHLKAFDKGIFVGVGGTFDVISGTKKRAPQIIQKLNIEWLYRIIGNKERIKRFYDSNVKFIFKLRKLAKEEMLMGESQSNYFCIFLLHRS